ncbi:hypothetical protein GCM10027343_09470 [Noviherbaspirillum agri]
MLVESVKATQRAFTGMCFNAAIGKRFYKRLIAATVSFLTKGVPLATWKPPMNMGCTRSCTDPYSVSIACGTLPGIAALHKRAFILTGSGEDGEGNGKV